MKAELSESGSRPMITIRAQTIAEAFALRYLFRLDQGQCDKCGHNSMWNNIAIDSNLPESESQPEEAANDQR